jgi:hypothetical protein
MMYLGSYHLHDDQEMGMKTVNGEKDASGRRLKKRRDKRDEPFLLRSRLFRLDLGGDELVVPLSDTRGIEARKRRRQREQGP